MFYACPPGTFTDGVGYTSCKYVATGTYGPLTGAYSNTFSCSTSYFSGSATCNAGKMTCTQSNIEKTLGDIYLFPAMGSGCGPGEAYNGSTCFNVTAGVLLYSPATLKLLLISPLLRLFASYIVRNI